MAQYSRTRSYGSTWTTTTGEATYTYIYMCICMCVFQDDFFKLNIGRGIFPLCNWLNDGQFHRIFPCINIERG